MSAKSLMMIVFRVLLTQRPVVAASRRPLSLSLFRHRCALFNLAPSGHHTTPYHQSAAWDTKL